uniref:Uncharacterized protein n=1 Tax=Catharus ustulatus TaxID=91951 RepID=A0A8C3TPG7_CATUS
MLLNISFLMGYDQYSPRIFCCVGFECFVLSLKIPNIAKKLEDFKKDVEAKKKPPNDKS